MPVLVGAPQRRRRAVGHHKGRQAGRQWHPRPRNRTPLPLVRWLLLLLHHVEGCPRQGMRHACRSWGAPSPRVHARAALRPRYLQHQAASGRPGELRCFRCLPIASPTEVVIGVLVLLPASSSAHARLALSCALQESEVAMHAPFRSRRAGSRRTMM